MRVCVRMCVCAQRTYIYVYTEINEILMYTVAALCTLNTCMHAYTHIHTCMHTHTCIRTQSLHSASSIHACMHTYIHIHTCMRTQCLSYSAPKRSLLVHTRLPSYISTYIYTHTHTHILCVSPTEHRHDLLSYIRIRCCTLQTNFVRKAQRKVVVVMQNVAESAV